MLHLVLALTTLPASRPDTGKHVFFAGDVGLVNTSGNTDLTTFSAGDKFVLLGSGWKLTQTFGVTYAKTQDSVTAELWQASVRGDRDLTRRMSLFILADFQRNTFAGLRSRFAPSFGLSSIVVAAPKDTLRIEVGGGYTSELAVPPDTNRSFPSGRFAAIYHHQLTAKAAFDEALEYLPNFSVGADYRINNEASISAPIATGIALKASYVIHYEGVPQPGFKRTDRILTTGIQVTF